MTTSLNGKVVLVTSGARRVGAAITRALHARGASVMIHHRTSAREAQGLVKVLNTQRAHSAACVPANLLNDNAPRKVVDACIKAFGRLDGLVNNASSFYPTKVGEITGKAWLDLIGTNLKAP